LKNIKKYKDGYGIGKEGNKLIVYLLLWNIIFFKKFVLNENLLK
jgi:hypothetical protein